MENGIKTENNKTFCKTCSAQLKIEIPDQIFNFCPFCSAPLNNVSYNLVKEKEKKLKLRTVSEIIELSRNVQTITDLKKYLNKISKE